MAEPISPQKSPYCVNVIAGHQYWWCACGRSKRQPFCDGSHAGTGHQPVPYSAKESKQLWFCGCKHTHTRPFCDSTHKTLA